MRRFTIPKEAFPDKKFSVTIEEPTYGIYREARKAYPVARSEDDPNKPGYQFEELLMAMCLKQVNEQDLASNSRDTVERLSSFTNPDRQYLFILFLEMFYASKEERSRANKHGEELSLDPQLSYSIDKHEMPSGSKSFTFYAGNTGAQMEVDRRYRGNTVQGCGMEDMFFAFCLSEVDGEQTETRKDIISILDDWTIADVQYATSLFLAMTTIDDGHVNSAKKLARELLASSNAPATQPVKSSVKASTSSANL